MDNQQNQDQGKPKNVSLEQELASHKKILSRHIPAIEALVNGINETVELNEDEEGKEQLRTLSRLVNNVQMMIVNANTNIDEAIFVLKQYQTAERSRKEAREQAKEPENTQENESPD